MDAQAKSQLENIVDGRIIRDPDEMGAYSRDECPYTEIRTTPEVVVEPATTEEISLILTVANRNKIPVTARGGGTGLCGGCVPIRGGIVLSLEGMNNIVEIDTDNLLATVEPGVTLTELTEAAAQHGLFFAPRPGDPIPLLRYPK